MATYMCCTLWELRSKLWVLDIKNIKRAIYDQYLDKERTLFLTRLFKMTTFSCETKSLFMLHILEVLHFLCDWAAHISGQWFNRVWHMLALISSPFHTWRASLWKLRWKFGYKNISLFAFHGEVLWSHMLAWAARARTWGWRKGLLMKNLKKQRKKSKMIKQRINSHITQFILF